MINLYLNLLFLLDFGFIMLCNWVVMGLMYIGLEDWVCYIDWFVDYFVECVCGGVGLIIIGGYVFNCIGWLLLFVFEFVILV